MAKFWYLYSEGSETNGYVYVWLSPFTVHLKLTTLLISYTPVQNKKFRKEKRVLEKKGTSLTIIKTKKTWLYKQ